MTTEVTRAGTEAGLEPDGQPDSEGCNGACEISSLRVAAASHVGRAHLETSTPCQDASEYRFCPTTDSFVAAVADGAGSSARSEQGAQAAVATLVSEALALMQQDASPCEALREAFDRAQKTVAALAESEQRDPGDYATTLLSVVWTKHGLVAAQTGDGAILADGELVLEPDRGEYVNETRFITSTAWQPTVRSIDGRIERLAMITDGLQDLALESGCTQPRPHAPFFDPLFRWLAEQADEESASSLLGSFLGSERIGERTHDDVTLLLAMRGGW